MLRGLFELEQGRCRIVCRFCSARADRGRRQARFALRDRGLVRLVYLHGLRASEAVGMRWRMNETVSNMGGDHAAVRNERRRGVMSR
jgi:integrase